MSVRNASAAGHSGQHFCVPKHTYKIVSTPSTWATASAAASKMRVGQHQGYLARVDSARENRVILEALSAHLSDKQLAGTLANDGSEAPFAGSVGVIRHLKDSGCGRTTATCSGLVILTAAL